MSPELHPLGQPTLRTGTKKRIHRGEQLQRPGGHPQTRQRTCDGSPRMGGKRAGNFLKK